jgi:hypothetical protein
MPEFSKSVRKSSAVIVCGVLIGSLLGAPLGAFLLSPNSTLRNHPDPQAKAMGIFLYPLEVFLTAVGLCFGTAVGGTVGGFAALLAQGRRTVTPSVEKSDDANAREQ